MDTFEKGAYTVLILLWAVVGMYAICLLHAIRKYGWPKGPSEMQFLKVGGPLPSNLLSILKEVHVQDVHRLRSTTMQTPDGRWKVRVETREDEVIAVDTEFTSVHTVLLNFYRYKKKGRPMFLSGRTSP